MHTDIFNSIVLDQLETQKAILIKKAGEYATDTDRLHNFRAGSQLTGQTMRATVAGMMLKHTTSVYDMLNAEEDTFSMEMWREKIGDHINYLLLSLAVVIEERGIRSQDEMMTHFENEIDRLNAIIRDLSQDAAEEVSEAEEDLDELELIEAEARSKINTVASEDDTEPSAAPTEVSPDATSPIATARKSVEEDLTTRSVEQHNTINIPIVSEGKDDVVAKKMPTFLQSL